MVLVRIVRLNWVLDVYWKNLNLGCRPGRTSVNRTFRAKFFVEPGVFIDSKSDCMGSMAKVKESAEEVSVSLKAPLAIENLHIKLLEFEGPPSQTACRILGGQDLLQG